MKMKHLQLRKCVLTTRQGRIFPSSRTQSLSSLGRVAHATKSPHPATNRHIANLFCSVKSLEIFVVIIETSKSKRKIYFKMSAQDAQEIIKGKVRRLSRFDLIDRLYAYLHPATLDVRQGPPGISHNDVNSSASENEDEYAHMDRNHTISRPPRQQDAVSDDHLRQLIRQEMFLRQPIQQSSTNNQQPLTAGVKCQKTTNSFDQS